MQDSLLQLVTLHPSIVYGVIFALSVVEGPIISMVGGALLHANLFSFWPMYGALMCGDLVGDVVWYWIGRQFGHRFIGRFGKYFSINEEGFEKVKKLFHTYKHRILFISKITVGLGFSLVTLMTAGMMRIPFFTYLGMNVLGQFVWSGFLIAIGYFFSNAYTSVNSVLGKLSVVALFVLFFLAFTGYKKYLRTRANALQLS